jgi:nicotinamidase-related amidase
MGRTVEVPEIEMQDTVRLPARKTAVIVVDMQNDFVKEGGKLVVPDAVSTLPAIQSLLGKARNAGVAIFYTQDTHHDGDPEWAIWGEHCRAGTWGHAIVDELAPHPGDRIIQKVRYDGFYGTSLDHELRVRGIRHLVIVGTMANICVLHTAGSAALRYYDVVVPVDGISALTPFDMEAAKRQIHFLYRGKLTTVEGVIFQ